jgi:DNA-binding NtrC family response regulator
MSAPRILIVEDDDLQCELYEEALTGYELLRFTRASEALQVLPELQPHLIILDHILAGGELGLDYLGEYRELLPYVPVIIVSGVLELQQQISALQGPRRAHYCVNKPVDLHELRHTVETAMQECGEVEVVRQFSALERSKRVDAQELLSRSTDRLSRQTQIRQALVDSGDRPNISALARQFRVARRTIIRDLLELIRRGELAPEVYPRSQAEADEKVSSP